MFRVLKRLLIPTIVPSLSFSLFKPERSIFSVLRAATLPLSFKAISFLRLLVLS